MNKSWGVYSQKHFSDEVGRTSSVRLRKHDSHLADADPRIARGQRAACKLVSMVAQNNRVRELFDLTGRVAVVTGGAGLLGYHHGAILAAAGANVVLLDLAVANPARRAEELQAHGRECLGLVVDITSEASLIEARDAIIARFGRVDCKAGTSPKATPVIVASAIENSMTR